jgi:glucans biosynthesis protein C
VTATELSPVRPAQAGATAAPTATGSRGPTRLFFADHIRVALTALVVIHHLAISFAVTIPGGWYYVTPDHSLPAEAFGLILVLVDQAFFMGAFFLLAGYFTPASYDRKSGGGFLRDRAIRLLIPLAVFYLVLGPISAIPLAFQYHLSLSWRTYLEAINPGPLWFVEVLFLFSCGYTALRLLVRRLAPRPVVEPAAPPSALAVILFTLGLAAVTFAFRQLIPLGHTIPVLQWPSPAYLPQYVGLFAVGAVAARRDWFRSIPDRMGWIGLVVSAVATIVLFLPALATGLKTGSFTGGMHWQAAAYALWDSTMSVGIFLGLLVIFRRWANAASRIWNELSRNAFGVYVLHAPLIVGLAVLMTPLHLYPLLGLLVAAVIALPLCFAVAGLVRRIPGVARVL